MPFEYAAFGLRLHCNERLPGLLPSLPSPDGVPADVDIRLNAMPPEIERLLLTARPYFVRPRAVQSGDSQLSVTTLGGGSYFRFVYEDSEIFVVDREGSQVWATWPDSEPLEAAALPLLGPIMGFVLRLRGTVCLHASAVVIDGRAVAILGPHGAGKSTTAAALAGRGYPILSDDLVALTTAGTDMLVQPAYPRLRLWPDSVSFLFGSPGMLPRIIPEQSVHSAWDKRYLDLGCDQRFLREPLPLAALYLLAPQNSGSAALAVTAATGHAGLMDLVVNSYHGYLLDRTMRTHEFQVLSRLLATVPLCRVSRSADLTRIPELCDLILADHHQQSPEPAAV